jgi:GTP pyrophosphokinase/guanosine-3',5'-bis(diphosphate) 3'-pyrophosphohydrolase
MHEFAERGIASHWKYKSSEKFSDLSWKEYDWLRDLVEIIETGNSPNIIMNLQNFKCFKKMFFVLLLKEL